MTKQHEQMIEALATEKDLEYDKHAKKWWRCKNCIANEKAQEEE